MLNIFTQETVQKAKLFATQRWLQPLLSKHLMSDSRCFWPCPLSCPLDQTQRSTSIATQPLNTTLGFYSPHSQCRCYICSEVAHLIWISESNCPDSIIFSMWSFCHLAFPEQWQAKLQNPELYRQATWTCCCLSLQQTNTSFLQHSEPQASPQCGLRLSTSKCCQSR